MNSFGLNGHELGVILAAAKNIPSIHKVLIFGSRALGTYRPGSDVDLALFCSDKGEDCVRELSTVLNQESILPYKFDIVLYHSQLDPHFKEHIDRYGQILYTR